MTREIDLDDYAPEDVVHVRTWLEFCADIIAVEPEANVERLKHGVRRLARRADELYPQLESGERVGMFPSDLGDWGLPLPVAEVFVTLTGNVLFLGDDGPRATAVELEAALDNLTSVGSRP